MSLSRIASKEQREERALEGVSARDKERKMTRVTFPNGREVSKGVLRSVPYIQFEVVSSSLLCRFLHSPQTFSKLFLIWLFCMK